MKRFLMLLIFMHILITCISQIVVNDTGSKVSVKDAQDALDMHNNARKAVNVSPLEWSVELAKYAQEWADFLANDNNCQLAHRGSMGKNPRNAGENIFLGSGRIFDALYASKDWYSEIKNYDHSQSAEMGYQMAGHYTQMVWSKTKKLGIGMATCKNGSIIIVGNYDPPGNYVGEKPF
jgi:pathogenesis-related protein 1